MERCRQHLPHSKMAAAPPPVCDARAFLEVTARSLDQRKYPSAAERIRILSPTLSNTGRERRRGLRRRRAQDGGRGSRSGQAAEISEAVGRPRPLRTSVPKPLLPRKPSFLCVRPPTPPSTSTRSPIAEGASERGGGAAPAGPETREGGGSGLWGRGRVGPRRAESARALPSRPEVLGQAGADYGSRRGPRGGRGAARQAGRATAAAEEAAAAGLSGGGGTGGRVAGVAGPAAAAAAAAAAG